MALRLPTDRRTLHVAIVSRTPRVAAPAADEERLFRPQTEAFGVLRHDARHAPQGAPSSGWRLSSAGPPPPGCPACTSTITLDNGAPTSDRPSHTARRNRLQDTACRGACGRRRETISSSNRSIRGSSTRRSTRSSRRSELRLAALKRRAAAAGMSCLYINDNFGQWRSDFRQTVAHCTSQSSPGHRVSRRLRPTKRDYFVLKPKHSGFFDTTLDTLLKALRAQAGGSQAPGRRRRDVLPVHQR